MYPHTKKKKILIIRIIYPPYYLNKRKCPFNLVSLHNLVAKNVCLT